MKRPLDFRRALEKGGERAVHAFLKQNSVVLETHVTGFDRCFACVPEFEFGAEYRADFLLLRPDSSGWHATLVELESPDAQLYTKRGTPARALVEAKKQIRDWRGWVRQNEPYFRHRLAAIVEAAPKAKRAAMRREFRNCWRHDLADLRHLLVVRYTIVIGRSSQFSEQDLRNYALEFGYGDVPDIMSYDRLLRQAASLDREPRRTRR